MIFIQIKKETVVKVPEPLQEEDIESDDFDPWALPTLQHTGPKWSGKYFLTFFDNIFTAFQCYQPFSLSKQLLFY